MKKSSYSKPGHGRQFGTTRGTKRAGTPMNYRSSDPSNKDASNGRKRPTSPRKS